MPVDCLAAEVVLAVNGMPVDDVHGEGAAAGTVGAEGGAGPSMIGRVDLDLNLVLTSHAMFTVFD